MLSVNSSPMESLFLSFQRGLKLIFLMVFKRFIGSKKVKKDTTIERPFGSSKLSMLLTHRPEEERAVAHMKIHCHWGRALWLQVGLLCHEIYYVNCWQYPTLSLYHAGISQEKGWNVLCFEDSGHKVLFVQTLAYIMNLNTHMHCQSIWTFAKDQALTPSHWAHCFDQASQAAAFGDIRKLDGGTGVEPRNAIKNRCEHRSFGIDIYILYSCHMWDCHIKTSPDCLLRWLLSFMPVYTVVCISCWRIRVKV